MCLHFWCFDIDKSIGKRWMDMKAVLFWDMTGRADGSIVLVPTTCREIDSLDRT